MVIYVTEDASYYVSKGNYSVNYHDNRNSDESYNMTMIFDAKIYIDSDRVLFKFDQLEVYSNQEDDVNVKDKLVGKWIEVPIDSSMDVFGMIDVGNRDAFSYIGDIIEKASEDKDTEKNGNIYTVNHTIMNENDTELKINLSDPENPCMIMLVDNNEDNKDTLYMYAVSTFRNIDNTVIDINVSDALVFETEEDFEDYMEG